MGTATVAIRKRTGITPTGSAVVADITLSSSYATGGETVPLSALGLKSIGCLVLSGGAAGYVCEAVHGASEATDPKIRLWEDKATAGATPFLEEGAGVNVTGVTVRAIAYGDLPNV